MTGNEMRMLARESNDKRIEGIYIEELNIIYDAARAGNYYADIDEVAIQDEFVDYLLRHDFKVIYHHKYNDVWYECRVASAVPWLSCDKIRVKW